MSEPKRYSAPWHAVEGTTLIEYGYRDKLPWEFVNALDYDREQVVCARAEKERDREHELRLKAEAARDFAIGLTGEPVRRDVHEIVARERDRLRKHADALAEALRRYVLMTDTAPAIEETADRALAAYRSEYCQHSCSQSDQPDQPNI